ncbi:MAG TPA: hypothetical protein VET27_26810 [Mycobacterium sp.]|nr:hypothetical protein [Mycobacterium sp.]
MTDTIAQLEFDLDGCDKEGVGQRLDSRGVSPSLLEAAFLVRSKFGRINDIVHAASISLALPELLDDGEILKRPSLAAGNDPTRPFDVETDRRVAEFKLAQWLGNDTARKNQLFKDFVQLAAAPPHLKAELYVLGDRPSRYLKSKVVTVETALSSFPQVAELFSEHFGNLDTSISDFALGPGTRVEVIDLQVRLPHLFATPAP